MAWYDHIHRVAEEIFPGAQFFADFRVDRDEAGEPQLTFWNSDTLGNLTEAEVIARCEQHGARANVPRSVSKAQGMMALYNAGLLGQLEDLIANHPYPPVRIWFANANQWERSNPYILSLGPELGLTEEGIDNLFKAAALLAS